jgi:hypothetical protein
MTDNAQTDPTAGTTSISVRDGSEYFRGLLLLLRMDKTLSAPEIDLMRRVGQRLGFEPGFCESAIRDILENSYVQQEAPHFSDPSVAAMFVRDGVTIALADGELHAAEEAWLQSVAVGNGLEAGRVGAERERRAADPGRAGLEADRLSVRYSP